MKIIVKGKNIAPHIESLPSEESVKEVYEQVRDRTPVGEETQEQFNARNANLLKAMLDVFNLDTGDEDGESDDSDFIIPSMFHYS